MSNARLDLPEPDVLQRDEPAGDLRLLGEEPGRLVDRHREHVLHALVLPADLERVGVEARAAALLADHFDWRQEVHLQRLHAGALAV